MIEIKQHILDYINDHFGISECFVKDYPLSTYIDSLDALEIIVDLETKYHIRIEDLWYDKWRSMTVDDIAKCVYDKLIELGQNDINLHAVENADKRISEVGTLDYGISAVADYDNGLTQGFKDGAKWMLDKVCAKFVEINKNTDGIVRHIVDVDQLRKELEK